MLRSLSDLGKPLTFKFLTSEHKCSNHTQGLLESPSG